MIFTGSVAYRDRWMWGLKVAYELLVLTGYRPVIWRSALLCQYVFIAGFAGEYASSIWVLFVSLQTGNISKPHKTCNIVSTCLEFSHQQRDQVPLLVTKYYTCWCNMACFMGGWSLLIKYCSVVWRSAVWCRYIGPSSYETNSCVSTRSLLVLLVLLVNMQCNLSALCQCAGCKYYSQYASVLVYWIWVKYGPILSRTHSAQILKYFKTP